MFFWTMLTIFRFPSTPKTTYISFFSPPSFFLKTTPRNKWRTQKTKIAILINSIQRNESNLTLSHSSTLQVSSCHGWETDTERIEKCLSNVRIDSSPIHLKLRESSFHGWKTHSEPIKNLECLLYAYINIRTADVSSHTIWFFPMIFWIIF